MWEQLLLSKRSDALLLPFHHDSTLLNKFDRNGWFYKFWDDRLQPLCFPLQAGNDRINIVMAQVDGKRVIDTHSGLASLLGADHPYARELRLDEKSGQPVRTGRYIGYRHGFGSESAAFPDFSEFCETQKADLLHILSEAHTGKTPDQVAMTPRQFTKPRATGTEWDRIATAMERGEHAGKAAVFDGDGKFLQMMEVGMHSPSAAIRPSGADLPPHHANTTPTYSLGSKKNSSIPNQLTGRWMAVASVAVGAILVGIAARDFLQRNDQTRSAAR